VQDGYEVNEYLVKANWRLRWLVAPVAHLAAEDVEVVCWRGDVDHGFTRSNPYTSLENKNLLLRGRTWRRRTWK